MLRRLFRRIVEDNRSHILYSEIVAQARRPDFYMAAGVPDTPDGRFDMIVLHVVLAMRRLRGEGEAGRELSQSLLDIFLTDMDRSLREMGVSDLSVPRRVRGMAEAFYGRAAAYDAAIDTADEQALRAALARNLLDTADTAAAGAVAAYVMACERSLAQATSERIFTLGFPWPEPTGAIGAGEGSRP